MSNISDEEWKKKLTKEQYRVAREKGTEPPFSSSLLKNSETGKYLCVCCGVELFSSETKFDSHCGWPAFYAASLKEANVLRQSDHSHGMVRTEVLCKNCGAHLGHVFDDGPVAHGGERFCINGISLKFSKK